MRKRTKQILGGLVLSGVVVASIGFWFEPRSLRVKHLDVETPGWPKSTAPVRVAVLSDIHIDSLHMPPKRVREIVQRVNALKPDLVLLAGDYIGGDYLKTGPVKGIRHLRSHSDNAVQEDGLRALNGFTATLGVYAVMGNHDCWWSCQRVRDVLKETRVQLLENQAAHIERSNGDIWIIGAEDGQTQEPDIPLAAASVPANAATILLEHNPGIFDWPTNHLPLQVSGHTHAGQVRLPLLGAPVRVSRHTEDTADGYEIIGERILIVSRGLGESGLPVRFGATPQIMLLTIRPGPTANVK